MDRVRIVTIGGEVKVLIRGFLYNTRDLIADLKLWSCVHKGCPVKISVTEIKGSIYQVKVAHHNHNHEQENYLCMKIYKDDVKKRALKNLQLSPEEVLSSSRAGNSDISHVLTDENVNSLLTFIKTCRELHHNDSVNSTEHSLEISEVTTDLNKEIEIFNQNNSQSDPQIPETVLEMENNNLPRDPPFVPPGMCEIIITESDDEQQTQVRNTPDHKMVRDKTYVKNRWIKNLLTKMRKQSSRNLNTPTDTSNSISHLENLQKMMLAVQTETPHNQTELRPPDYHSIHQIPREPHSHFETPINNVASQNQTELQPSNYESIPTRENALCYFEPPINKAAIQNSNQNKLEMSGSQALVKLPSYESIFQNPPNGARHTYFQASMNNAASQNLNPSNDVQFTNPRSHNSPMQITNSLTILQNIVINGPPPQGPAVNNETFTPQNYNETNRNYFPQPNRYYPRNAHEIPHYAPRNYSRFPAGHRKNITVGPPPWNYYGNFNTQLYQPLARHPGHYNHYHYQQQLTQQDQFNPNYTTFRNATPRIQRRNTSNIPIGPDTNCGWHTSQNRNQYFRGQPHNFSYPTSTHYVQPSWNYPPVNTPNNFNAQINHEYNPNLPNNPRILQYPSGSQNFLTADHNFAKYCNNTIPPVEKAKNPTPNAELNTKNAAQNSASSDNLEKVKANFTTLQKDDKENIDIYEFVESPDDPDFDVVTDSNYNKTPTKENDKSKSEEVISQSNTVRAYNQVAKSNKKIYPKDCVEKSLKDTNKKIIKKTKCDSNQNSLTVSLDVSYASGSLNVTQNCHEQLIINNFLNKSVKGHAQKVTSNLIAPKSKNCFEYVCNEGMWYKKSQKSPNRWRCVWQMCAAKIEENQHDHEEILKMIEKSEVPAIRVDIIKITSRPYYLLEVSKIKIHGVKKASQIEITVAALRDILKCKRNFEDFIINNTQQVQNLVNKKLKIDKTNKGRLTEQDNNKIKGIANEFTQTSEAQPQAENKIEELPLTDKLTNVIRGDEGNIKARKNNELDNVIIAKSIEPNSLNSSSDCTNNSSQNLTISKDTEANATNREENHVEKTEELITKVILTKVDNETQIKLTDDHKKLEDVIVVNTNEIILNKQVESNTNITKLAENLNEVKFIKIETEEIIEQNEDIQNSQQLEIQENIEIMDINTEEIIIPSDEDIEKEGVAKNINNSLDCNLNLVEEMKEKLHCPQEGNIDNNKNDYSPKLIRQSDKSDRFKNSECREVIHSNVENAFVFTSQCHDEFNKHWTKIADTEASKFIDPKANTEIIQTIDDADKHQTPLETPIFENEETAVETPPHLNSKIENKENECLSRNEQNKIEEFKNCVSPTILSNSKEILKSPKTVLIVKESINAKQFKNSEEAKDVDQTIALPIVNNTGTLEEFQNIHYGVDEISDEQTDCANGELQEIELNEFERSARYCEDAEMVGEQDAISSQEVSDNYGEHNAVTLELTNIEGERVEQHFEESQSLNEFCKTLVTEMDSLVNNRSKSIKKKNRSVQSKMDKTKKTINKTKENGLQKNLKLTALINALKEENTEITFISCNNPSNNTREITEEDSGQVENINQSPSPQNTCSDEILASSSSPDQAGDIEKNINLDWNMNNSDEANVGDSDVAENEDNNLSSEEMDAELCLSPIRVIEDAGKIANSLFATSDLTDCTSVNCNKVLSALEDIAEKTDGEYNNDLEKNNGISSQESEGNKDDDLGEVVEKDLYCNRGTDLVDSFICNNRVSSQYAANLRAIKILSVVGGFQEMDVPNVEPSQEPQNMLHLNHEEVKLDEFENWEENKGYDFSLKSSNFEKILETNNMEESTEFDVKQFENGVEAPAIDDSIVFPIISHIFERFPDMSDTNVTVEELQKVQENLEAQTEVKQEMGEFENAAHCCENIKGIDEQNILSSQEVSGDANVSINLEQIPSKIETVVKNNEEETLLNLYTLAYQLDTEMSTLNSNNSGKSTNKERIRKQRKIDKTKKMINETTGRIFKQNSRLSTIISALKESFKNTCEIIEHQENNANQSLTSQNICSDKMDLLENIVDINQNIDIFEENIHDERAGNLMAEEMLAELPGNENNLNLEDSSLINSNVDSSLHIFDESDRDKKRVTKKSSPQREGKKDEELKEIETDADLNFTVDNLVGGSISNYENSWFKEVLKDIDGNYESLLQEEKGFEELVEVDTDNFIEKKIEEPAEVGLAEISLSSNKVDFEENGESEEVECGIRKIDMSSSSQSVEQNERTEVEKIFLQFNDPQNCENVDDEGEFYGCEVLVSNEVNYEDGARNQSENVEDEMDASYLQREFNEENVQESFEENCEASNNFDAFQNESAVELEGVGEESSEVEAFVNCDVLKNERTVNLEEICDSDLQESCEETFDDCEKWGEESSDITEEINYEYDDCEKLEEESSEINYEDGDCEKLVEESSEISEENRPPNMYYPQAPGYPPHMPPPPRPQMPPQMPPPQQQMQQQQQQQQQQHQQQMQNSQQPPPYRQQAPRQQQPMAAPRQPMQQGPRSVQGGPRGPQMGARFPSGPRQPGMAPRQRAPMIRGRGGGPMMGNRGPRPRMPMQNGGQMQQGMQQQNGPRIIKRTPEQMQALQAKRKKMDVLVPDKHDDADCQVIAVTPKNTGLPQIQSIQGAAADPCDNSVMHLSDSITLSVRNPPPKPASPKKSDAKDVANILATRGITVTATAKSKEAAKATSKSPEPATPVAINLNSSVCIIPTKNQVGNAPGGANNKDNKLATVDLTDDTVEPPPPQQHQQQKQMPGKQQQTNKVLPFQCDLCPAKYTNSLNLSKHRQSFHKTGSNVDYGVPLIDLKSPGVVQRLASLGIHNYIPLPGANNETTFALPIINANTYKNGNLNNIGATQVLTLGPVRMLPKPVQNHK